MAGRVAGQQRVQPVPYADLLLHELVPCVDQQLHVRIQVGRVHLWQVLFPNGHGGDNDRVTLIVLTPAASGPSSLGGRVRGDVNDLLVGSQEQLSVTLEI